MSNSFFIRGITKSAKLIAFEFKNSRLYKIFSGRARPSRSIIVRASMDKEYAESSVSYKLIERITSHRTKRTENSSFFLKATDKPFLCASVTLVMGAALFGFLKYTDKIESTLPMLICACLFVMTKAAEYIIGKELYKSSLLYKFFSYAYRLEEKDGE